MGINQADWPYSDWLLMTLTVMTLLALPTLAVFGFVFPPAPHGIVTLTLLILIGLSRQLIFPRKKHSLVRVIVAVTIVLACTGTVLGSAFKIAWESRFGGAI